MPKREACVWAPAGPRGWGDPRGAAGARKGRGPPSPPENFVVLEGLFVALHLPQGRGHQCRQLPQRSQPITQQTETHMSRTQGPSSGPGPAIQKRIQICQKLFLAFFWPFDFMNLVII